jgi:arylsulfatase A-like enzyme
MWDCAHTQRSEWLDVPADRFTYFSSRLAEAGYYNGYFGKWHVEQTGKLENFGWHEYDCADGGMGCKASAKNRVVVPKEGYRDYLLAGVDESGTEPRHPTFEQGIDFICRAAQGQKPFCCFVSTKEPHDPYIPPKQFLDMYDLNNIALSPTLRNEPMKKPEIVRRMRAEWSALTDDDWRRIRAAYWAVITTLDREVGRIIEALKETGQYENTIIVFTSDHGDMLGGHGLATKGVGTPYEEVYNIPLIMRVPGITHGIEDAQTLTSPIDLAPTLLDLCGVAELPDAQGRSLRPVIVGSANSEDWRDAYAEFFGQRFVYTQRIVWHAEWKYVFSPGGIDELYNLVEDPHERNNLADDPNHRDVLIEMCKRMWRKMKEIGDDSLFNTQYATLRTAPIGPFSVNDE